MKARVVCLPMGKPLVANSLLWLVMLIFSLAALLLTSCTNGANPEFTTTPTAHAATATPTHDFAYQYSDTNETAAPISGIGRFTNADNNATACISSLDEMRTMANTPTQIFAITTKKDTVLTGEKGIKVHIPANCFKTASPNAEVKIILKEYNSNADFFFANLTTNSNGNMLESGGTVYINAMSDGKAVGLKKGKKIALAFPTGKAKPGMQTFYGEKKSDGSINWQPTTQVNNSADYFSRLFYPYRVKWISESVKKTKLVQRTSTLTNWKFQIQAYGSNDHCTRFADSSSYKNVLEYFQDNFTVSDEDFKLLQGTFLTYAYTLNSNGDCVKPELRLEFNGKAGLFNKKAKKEAVVRMKAHILQLLQDMPKGETSRYLRKEIIRFYINQFNSHKYAPLVVINDNQVKKTYWDYSYHPDSISWQEFEAWNDSVNYIQTVKRDSLLKNDADFYFMNAGKLGWINCDRFYDNNRPKDAIIVDGGGSEKLNVRVVFKNIMSVMQLQLNTNGQYQALNIPMGEEVRYIVIDKRADGLYYAVKDAVTGTKKVEGFAFKPMTMDAMKKELASL